MSSRLAILIKEFVEKSIEYEYANMPDEYCDRWRITEATKAKVRSLTPNAIINN